MADPGRAAPGGGATPEGGATPGGAAPGGGATPEGGATPGGAAPGGAAPGGAAPGPARLDDAAVRERLTRVEELLGRLELTPGPTAETGLDAVCALAEVYGEALARASALVVDTPAARAAFTGDELLTQLLVLHGVHPDPPERRIRTALETLRPELAARGAEVELTSFDNAVATVQISGGGGSGGGCGSGCGSGAASSGTEIADAVRDAVLAVAPELSEVRLSEVRASEVAAPSAAEPAFLPVESLRLRPRPRERVP
jgi:Fe-S cluster biogenesis protein NfuA